MCAPGAAPGRLVGFLLLSRCQAQAALSPVLGPRVMGPDQQPRVVLTCVCSVFVLKGEWAVWGGIPSHQLTKRLFCHGKEPGVQSLRLVD